MYNINVYWISDSGSEVPLCAVKMGIIYVWLFLTEKNAFVSLSNLVSLIRSMNYLRKPYFFDMKKESTIL